MKNELTISQNFFYNPQNYTQTMRRKELAEILLSTDGWVFAQGECYDIKSRNLGSGIVQVYLKKKKL